jgi:hypothetical protein
MAFRARVLATRVLAERFTSSGCLAKMSWMLLGGTPRTEPRAIDLSFREELAIESIRGCQRMTCISWQQQKGL